MEINEQKKQIEEKKTKKHQLSIFRNIYNKFKWSFAGIGFCLKNESSFLLMAVCSCIIIIGGIFFDITFLEWVVTLGSIIFIGVIELINTAIEAAVDMVTQEYNEYAKIAKDCGSGATFLMMFLATLANLIVFFPYIVKLFL